MKYDGDASLYPASDGRVRVWIQAPNVTAEVYISRDRAADLRDWLNHELRHWPQPNPDEQEPR